MVAQIYRKLGVGQQSTGVLLVLLSCASLQIGAAFAVHLFPIMGAWAVTCLRLSVAAILVGLLARPRFFAWNRQQWGGVLFFGVAMGAMNTSFYHAIELIPLGLAVAVEFTGPLVLAALLSRQKIDALWISLAACGLLLLGWEASSTNDVSFYGIALALLAGFFWALYILGSSKVGKLIPGNGGLAGALAVGALFTMPLGFHGSLEIFTDWKLFAFAVGTGLMASFVPYLAELAALRRLPENVFSILLSLEPAIAALAGFILLQQETGLLRWVAILLLMGASTGITFTSRKSDFDSELLEEPPLEHAVANS